jgi:hypothetical protein
MAIVDRQPARLPVFGKTQDRTQTFTQRMIGADRRRTAMV